MEYIEGDKLKNGCVFCIEMGKTDGPDNLIAYRGIHSFVILNRFPYTSGHVMIVPYDHQASLEQLDPETRAEMMELTSQSLQVLQLEYRPQGFNIGINIGAAAGAGILDHVHVHVVPRWGGDTNFMTALAQTRVLPETLDETYTRVIRGWGIVKNAR
jgi:ATP adenylyltransferase